MIKKMSQNRARENGPSCCRRRRRRSSKPDARTRRGAFSRRSRFVILFISLSLSPSARAFSSSSCSSTTNQIRALEGKEKSALTTRRRRRRRRRRRPLSLSPKGDLSKTTKHETHHQLNRRYLRSRKTWRSSSNAPRGKTGRF